MSHIVPSLLIVASIGAALAFSVEGAESPSDELQPSVASVLHAETEPLRPIDRRALLRDVLEQNPHAPSARWQAGYVRIADEWRPFEEAVETMTMRCAISTAACAAPPGRTPGIRCSSRTGAGGTGSLSRSVRISRRRWPVPRHSTFRRSAIGSVTGS